MIIISKTETAEQGKDSQFLQNGFAHVLEKSHILKMRYRSTQKQN